MTYKKFYDIPNEDEGLAYDLRSFYARVVGLNILEVCKHKTNGNYSAWLNALLNWYSSVKHKIAKKNGEKFQGLLDDALEIINKHRAVFLRKSFNEEGVWKITNALLKIEMYLYDAMEDKRMFGEFRESGL